MISIDKDKIYIAFFHNSQYDYDEIPALFKPRLREENKIKDVRPVFYWFSEHWHSNIPSYREKYFYLFVKNPKSDNIQFRARHEDYDFNGLYSHYVEYLGNRANKNLAKLYGRSDWKEYVEPSILMSFSDIEPDLILQFSSDKDRCGTILKPITHKGIKICLFDKDHYPIKFTDIPEIVEIVPQIKNSYPFIKPTVSNGKYVYEDWNTMVTENMGSWI